MDFPLVIGDDIPDSHLFERHFEETVALVGHLECWVTILVQAQITMWPELLELVVVDEALHHFVFVSVTQLLEACLFAALRFEDLNHLLHLQILLLLFFK